MDKNPFEIIFPNFKEYSNISDSNLLKLLKRVRNALMFVFHSDRSENVSDKITKDVNDSANYLVGKIEQPDLIFERMKEQYFKSTPREREVIQFKSDFEVLTMEQKKLSKRLINNLLLTESGVITYRNNLEGRDCSSLDTFLPCKIKIGDCIEDLQKSEYFAINLHDYKVAKNKNPDIKISYDDDSSTYQMIVRSVQDFENSDSITSGRIKIIGSYYGKDFPEVNTVTSMQDIRKMFKEYYGEDYEEIRLDHKLGYFIPMRIFEKYAVNLSNKIQVGRVLVSYGRSYDVGKKIPNAEGVFFEGHIIRLEEA